MQNWVELSNGSMIDLDTLMDLIKRKQKQDGKKEEKHRWSSKVTDGTIWYWSKSDAEIIRIEMRKTSKMGRWEEWMRRNGP